MASNAAAFAYLQSRVSVRSEQLLKPAQLQMLIDCSVEDESRCLAEAGLGALDQAILDDPLKLEQGLVLSLIEDIQTLVHAVSATPREMLIYWARRYELGNLKAIIRGKMTGETPDAIRSQLVDIGVFATLPVDDLLRTDDTAELLRRVETTPYAEIARHARRVYEEQQALFGLDAAVDRRYYAGLNKRAKAVGEGGGEPLRALIGTIIDRLNISWLLRYRFAYQLAPAEAYYLLIPAGFHVNSADLMALAQLNDPEEVVAQMPVGLRRILSGRATLADIDDALEAHTWRVAEHTLHSASFNLARAFAYLVLRERDLNRVSAIVKGKRLRISPDLIRQATQLAEPTQRDKAEAPGAAA